MREETLGVLERIRDVAKSTLCRAIMRLVKASMARLPYPGRNFLASVRIWFEELTLCKLSISTGFSNRLPRVYQFHRMNQWGYICSP